MEAKEGEGFLFDKLLVSSFGWGIGGGDHRGNDPNRMLRVNAEKAGMYRFDVNYRRFDYFNSLTTLALNQHTANTEYRQGDFDLTILPNNQKFRTQSGLFAEPKLRACRHDLGLSARRVSGIGLDADGGGRLSNRV